jgi:5-methylcytosine-specific restriction protein B
MGMIFQGTSPQETEMNNQTFPPMDLSRKELEQAICRIDESGFHPHHQSHTYAVRHNGKLYPPIPIVAFAIEAREGRPIATGVIGGGKNTPAFKILRREGFEIIHRNES